VLVVQGRVPGGNGAVTARCTWSASTALMTSVDLYTNGTGERSLSGEKPLENRTLRDTRAIDHGPKWVASSLPHSSSDSFSHPSGSSSGGVHRPDG
jgi:hypothetical protein